MSRVLSIAASFFAASFIVLMVLGLLAWSSTAALADEPLTYTSACSGQNGCFENAGEGGNCFLYNCDSFCCCNCDVNCNCHDTLLYNDPLSGCDGECF